MQIIWAKLSKGLPKFLFKDEIGFILPTDLITQEAFPYKWNFEITKEYKTGYDISVYFYEGLDND